MGILVPAGFHECPVLWRAVIRNIWPLIVLDHPDSDLTQLETLKGYLQGITGRLIDELSGRSGFSIPKNPSVWNPIY